jgi:hypothetical protein
LGAFQYLALLEKCQLTFFEFVLILIPANFMTSQQQNLQKESLAGFAFGLYR